MISRTHNLGATVIHTFPLTLQNAAEVTQTVQHKWSWLEAHGQLKSFLRSSSHCPALKAQISQNLFGSLCCITF